MLANFQATDPVTHLMDELVDGLHLLHVCRARGVSDLDRLLEYIEYTIDQIEHHRLGASREFFFSEAASEDFVTTEWCDEFETAADC
jgi:hypothetical protein